MTFILTISTSFFIYIVGFLLVDVDCPGTVLFPYGVLKTLPGKYKDVQNVLSCDLWKQELIENFLYICHFSQPFDYRIILVSRPYD